MELRHELQLTATVCGGKYCKANKHTFSGDERSETRRNSARRCPACAPATCALPGGFVQSTVVTLAIAEIIFGAIARPVATVLPGRVGHQLAHGQIVRKFRLRRFAPWSWHDETCGEEACHGDVAKPVETAPNSKDGSDVVELRACESASPQPGPTPYQGMHAWYCR